MFSVLTRRRNPPPANDGFGLFVYGTLMTGERNHFVMEELMARKHATLVDPEATASNMVVVDLQGMPAMYAASVDIGPSLVHGEMYRLTAQARAVLDLFEGTPHVYRRNVFVARWRVDGERAVDQMASAYFGPLWGPPDQPAGRAIILAGDFGAAHATSRWRDRQLRQARDWPQAFLYKGTASFYPAGAEANGIWPAERMNAIDPDVIFDDDGEPANEEGLL